MRLMFLAACALPVFAATAYAAPKPVAPPHSHHNAVRPVPYPGAAPATKSALSTSSASTSVSAQIPPAVRTPARVTIVFRRAHGPVAPAAPQRPARHTRASPPAQQRGRPAGWQDAAGLHELSSVASSGGSAVLLAAGIALLLLVIAETTFLGFASSRLVIAPVRRRSAEEPFPIRRVQVRR
jgi:hypothetical protein